MGATVQFELSNSVAYLIVGEIHSNKYIVASEEGIPTVTKDWVDYLWNVSVHQLQPFAPSSATFKEVSDSFRSGIFQGCTISCSNVDSDEKEQLARLITTHGGVYATSMDRNKCTHLAMGGPGGEKFKYAKEWGMTIITTKWITDSVQKGFAQLVTRKKYQAANEVADEATPKDIQPQCTTMNEELVELTHLNNQCLDLFDDMCFFVSGFTEELTRKLEAVMRTCGGFVFDKYCASVTHVIMNKEDLENNADLKMNSQIRANCSVVNFKSVLLITLFC